MKNEGPARMVAFGWLVLQGKILMMGNLIRKKMIVGNSCPLCLADRESGNHLLNCKVAHRLWNSVLGLVLLCASDVYSKPL